MKLGFKRGQKGFTLVELLVVAAILAVLGGIVFPAVTGTKTVSTESQVVSDGSSTQKAVDSYNSKASKPRQWPEVALGTLHKLPTGTQIYLKGAVSASYTVLAGDAGGANALGTQTGWVSGTDYPSYVEVKFDRVTQVWQPDGQVNDVNFVPDFLMKTPVSVAMDNDELLYDTRGSPNKLKEFLWLLKVNNAGSADESRTLQVFRLVEPTALNAIEGRYVQLF